MHSSVHAVKQWFRRLSRDNVEDILLYTYRGIDIFPKLSRHLSVLILEKALFKLSFSY